MLVALRDCLVVCETFHPKQGRLLHEGQITPHVHTLILNGRACCTVTFLKPHFLSVRSVMSPCAQAGHGSAVTWKNSWNASIEANWKKRGWGGGRKVDTPNCNVRCWPFDSVLEKMMPFGDIMQENWATLNVFLCGEFRGFFFLELWNQ